MPKAVILLLVLHVLAAFGDGSFMIKNKRTGMVLDGKQKIVTIGPYENRNSQLWTSKPGGKPNSVIFINKANGRALESCPRTKQIFSWHNNGNSNQLWYYKPTGKLIDDYYPNLELVHKNNKLFLDGTRSSDQSDEWLLVEPLS